MFKGLHVISAQERMKHTRRGFPPWTLQGGGDAGPHSIFSSDSQLPGFRLSVPGLEKHPQGCHLRENRLIICPDDIWDRKLYGENKVACPPPTCVLPAMPPSLGVASHLMAGKLHNINLEKPEGKGGWEKIPVLSPNRSHFNMLSPPLSI